MRRQPIPPLRGGAIQALPNIQTTLRHHPHPASRPMTLGHFTSWPADDRGYYTGVERARERERDTEREREREREELVTFLGQIPGKIWEYTKTSVTYDMVWV